MITSSNGIKLTESARLVYGLKRTIDHIVNQYEYDPHDFCEFELMTAAKGLDSIELLDTMLIQDMVNKALKEEV